MRSPVRLGVGLLGLLVMSTGASGCFKLSRSSPPIREYVLRGATPPAAEGRLTVGIRRADVASYLSGPAIMVRRGDNEIVASEFHRWREPLDEAINRVVATNLTGLSPVRAVDVAPWATRSQHDYWVQLHIVRFEGVTNASGGTPRTEMDASWDIVRPVDGRVLVRGRTTLREGAWNTGDYSTLVNALDGTLATLARDIASCLGGFRNDSTPPSRCGTGASTVAR
jgi:uncharacterized lipoprotein YmbA